MQYLKVTACGRTATDTTLKYTTDGKAICTVGVICNRTNGKGEKDGVFIEIVAFGKTGEYLSETAKGSLISVVGDLRSSKWTDDYGNKREKWSIVVECFNAEPKKNNRFDETDVIF